MISAYWNLDTQVINTSPTKLYMNVAKEAGKFNF